MKALLLIVSFMFVSCASQPAKLSREVASVKVLLKSDAPSKCKEIKQVFAGGNVWTGQYDMNEIKIATANVGGDTFVKTQDLHGAPGSVYGLAYKCKRRSCCPYRKR